MSVNHTFFYPMGSGSRAVRKAGSPIDALRNSQIDVRNRPFSPPKKVNSMANSTSFYTPISDRAQLTILKTHVIVKDVAALKRKKELKKNERKRMKMMEVDTEREPRPRTTRIPRRRHRKPHTAPSNVRGPARKDMLDPLPYALKAGTTRPQTSIEDGLTTWSLTRPQTAVELEHASAISWSSWGDSELLRASHSPYTKPMFKPRMVTNPIARPTTTPSEKDIANMSPMHRPPPQQDIHRELLAFNPMSEKVTLQDVEEFGQRMLDTLSKDVFKVRDEVTQHTTALHSTIERERDRLPLTFLFERSTQDYCQRRAIENVDRVLKRLLSAQLSAGVRKWKKFVELQRDEEAEARLTLIRQGTGAEAMKLVGKRLLNKKLYQALRRWKFVIRLQKKEEKKIAAIVIQKWWRNFLSWFNALNRAKKKAANERKRSVMICRALFMEWLAKRRKDLHITRTRRRILEEESATFIQKVYRLYLKRVEAQQELRERKAKACFGRMMNRRVAAAYTSWHMYTMRSLRMKDMFRMALLGTMHMRFELWYSFAQNSLNDKKNESMALNCLRRFLFAAAGKCFKSWATFVYQRVKARNMMRRALSDCQRFRFELWAIYAEDCRMAKMDAAARRKAENEQKVRQCLARIKNQNLSYAWISFRENVLEARKNKEAAAACLVRMLNRKMSMAYTSWASFVARQKQVKKMMYRALLGVVEDRFLTWCDFVADAKFQRADAAEKRRIENEQKVVRCIMRMQNRVVSVCFLLLQNNAVTMRRVKQMVRRAMGHKQAKYFGWWCEFIRDCRLMQAKANAALKRWLNRHMASSFRSWAVYCYRIKHVRKMARAAFMGKRQKVFEGWANYTLRCKVYKCQTTIQSCFKDVRKGHHALSTEDLEWANEFLRYSPMDIERDEYYRLESILKQIEDMFDLETRMALRVQCAYRCKGGRYALFVLKRAREQRRLEEIEELKKMEWAVRKIQQNYRGRRGRLYFKDLLVKKKKDAIREQYILERKAQEARERWEADKYEMMYREKIQREVEERREAERLAFEAEQKRIAAQWTRVRTEEYDGSDDKDPVYGKDGEEILLPWKEGTFYYYNNTTYESQWHTPRGYVKPTGPKPPTPRPEEILKAWCVREDEQGNVFFFNQMTEESRWDKPKGWEPPIPEGKCSKCRSEDAVRQCRTCDLPYCLECFLEDHSTASKRGHLFRVLKKTAPPPFKCIECRTESAVRATPDFKRSWCLNCFDYIYDHDDELKVVGYRRFVADSKVCAECEMKLAVRECRQCDDVYCEECFQKLHKTGQKASHSGAIVNPWEKDELKDGETFCTECEQRVADRVCDQCGDAYCEHCFKRLHAKGRKAVHTSTTWEDFKTPWEEFWDEDQQRHIYYNTVTKERKYDKPAALLWGTEKMAWQEQDTSKDEALAEKDDELAQLKKQMAMMEDQMANMSVKKKSLLGSALLSVASKIAPSIAVDEEQQRKEDDAFLENFDYTSIHDKGAAQRAREIRKKRRAAKGTKLKKSGILKKALFSPLTAITSPLQFSKEHERDTRGLDERYLRKMMVGKKKFDNLDTEEAKKEAEVRAYEAQMMSFLADAREKGREDEYKNEMLKVKELREKNLAKEKLQDRDKAAAARFGKGKKIK